MKRKIRITVVLLFAFLQSMLVQTVTAMELETEVQSPIVMKSGKPRPRSNEAIPLCYYCHSGDIYIIGDESISYISATVTRLDDNNQWCNSSSGNMLTVQVSMDPGTYLLEVILSDGAYYYGEYMLQ